MNFSEAFIAWIHIKGLRVFVESVLRCVEEMPSPGSPAVGGWEDPALGHPGSVPTFPPLQPLLGHLWLSCPLLLQLLALGNRLRGF